MKKFVITVIISLVVSLTGFSQERSAKKPEPPKTEHVKKVSTKSGSRPKKPVRKKIQRRGTMRHGHKVKT